MAEHDKRIAVSITTDKGLQQRAELYENFEDLCRHISAWLIVRTARPLPRFVQPSALLLWRAARKRFGMPPIEARGEGES